MFYICSKRADDVFGVIDTEDDVVEYYTSKQLITILKEDRVNIRGAVLTNTGIRIKAFNKTEAALLRLLDACKGYICSYMFTDRAQSPRCYSWDGSEEYIGINNVEYEELENWNTIDGEDIKLVRTKDGIECCKCFYRETRNGNVETTECYRKTINNLDDFKKWFDDVKYAETDWE